MSVKIKMVIVYNICDYKWLAIVRVIENKVCFIAGSATLYVLVSYSSHV